MTRRKDTLFAVAIGVARTYLRAKGERTEFFHLNLCGSQNTGKSTTMRGCVEGLGRNKIPARYLDSRVLLVEPTATLLEELSAPKRRQLLVIDHADLLTSPEIEELLKARNDLILVTNQPLNNDLKNRLAILDMDTLQPHK